MRRRIRLLLGAALVALLLCAILLLLHTSSARRGLSVGFTTARGHFPEPGLIYDDHIRITWVTNTGHFTLTLENPRVQYENEQGRLVLDMGGSWDQKGYQIVLPPRGVTWHATGFGPDRKRLRFMFDFHRSGGPLLKAISKVVGLLPPKRIPQRVYDWLHRNGLADGNVYGHYETAWFVPPHEGGNPAQPPHLETNRSSAATATGRSPER